MMGGDLVEVDARDARPPADEGSTDKHAINDIDVGHIAPPVGVDLLTIGWDANLNP